MKLLEYKDYRVSPTPEAFLVKPIRKMYNSDRTKSKETFMQQLAYLYFMTDPRSPYIEIPDEDDRKAEVCKQEGLPENFRPSSDLKEAMSIYEKLTITSSKRLLEATRTAADALKEELESSKELLSERTDKGARVTKPNDIIAVMERLLKVIPQLQDLERKVDSEIRETTRARGTENTLFEDGV